MGILSLNILEQAKLWTLHENFWTRLLFNLINPMAIVFVLEPKETLLLEKFISLFLCIVQYKIVLVKWWFLIPKTKPESFCDTVWKRNKTQLDLDKVVCSCVVLCMTCCRFPRWAFKFTQRSRISSTNCSFTTTVFRETEVFWLYICAGLHLFYSVTMVMCIYTAWGRKLFLFSMY